MDNLERGSEKPELEGTGDRERRLLVGNIELDFWVALTN